VGLCALLASTIAGGLVTPGGDVLASSAQSPTHAGPGANALDGLLSTIHRLQGEARARGIGGALILGDTLVRGHSGRRKPKVDRSTYEVSIGETSSHAA
jgi:hypothetical protein